MSTKTPKLVALTLYRNLLRAAKPFTAPSPHARVLNSLLNRTGIDDHLPDWEGLVVSTARDLKEQGGEGTKRLEGDKNIESTQGVDRKESIPPNQTSQRLFRRLLREVVCAGDPNGIAKSTWPSLVDPTILWNVIRREFRDGPSSHSVNFDVATRRQVAFRALRELNKKLCYFDHLEKSSSIPLPYQGASRVSPLPFIPSSEYLRPGVFLLAHPHMTGDSFFSKAVICILEHQDENKRIDGEDEESASKRAVDVPGLQTYGLIVNRASVHSDTGRNRTLKEAFEQQAFPGKLIEVFGDSIVREGGPVHVALQMLHSLPSSTDEDSSNGMSIGGRIIPVIPEDNDSSTALYSDRATYFQGEIFKAMAAVEDGRMDHDDVSFFVGASTWSIGQLRREVEEGFWLPCRGPPEIALSGICEHNVVSDSTSTGTSTKRPLADLWLSMMSACGEEEAKLAHLYYNEDELHDYGLPCDIYDKDDNGFF